LAYPCAFMQASGPSRKDFRLVRLFQFPLQRDLSAPDGRNPAAPPLQQYGAPMLAQRQQSPSVIERPTDGQDDYDPNLSHNDIHDDHHDVGNYIPDPGALAVIMAQIRLDRVANRLCAGRKRVPDSIVDRAPLAVTRHIDCRSLKQKRRHLSGAAVYNQTVWLA
jgi:hypothetical protein